MKWLYIKSNKRFEDGNAKATVWVSKFKCATRLLTNGARRYVPKSKMHTSVLLQGKEAMSRIVRLRWGTLLIHHFTAAR